LGVRLDLDSPRLESDEGKGDRAREHTPKLCVQVRPLCAVSARDQHIFEELAGATAGAPVHVPA
jgi:hypothetical protein